MADISMCSNKTCPSRLKCHRFTAPQGMWQSWQEYAPKKGEKKCEDFWDNKGYTKEKKS